MSAHFPAFTHDDIFLSPDAVPSTDIAKINKASVDILSSTSTLCSRQAGAKMRMNALRDYPSVGLVATYIDQINKTGSLSFHIDATSITGEGQ